MITNFTFRILHLLFVVGLLNPLMSATAQILEGTDPPFSQTQDILRGEYEVLAVDDLFMQQHITLLDEGGELISNWTPGENGDADTENRISLRSHLASNWLNTRTTKVTVATRMFNSPNDTVFTAFYGGTGPNHLYLLQNPAAGFNAHQFSNSSFNALWVEPGDFNGDGLNEIVVYSDTGGSRLFIVHPDNINDMSQGVHEGPSLAPALSTPGSTFYTAGPVGAAGDLDGDGFDEIVLYYRSDACPNGSTLVLDVYTVDPSSFEIQLKSTTCVIDPPSTTVYGIGSMGIAIGHLKPLGEEVVNPGDPAPSPPLYPEQIALLVNPGQTNGVFQHGAMATFELDSSGSIVQNGTPLNPYNGDSNTYWEESTGYNVMKPRAARLLQAPFRLANQPQAQTSDWLVLGGSHINEAVIVDIVDQSIQLEFLAFDPDLNVIQHDSANIDQNTFSAIQDFTIGNFDQETPTALQIAILGDSDKVGLPFLFVQIVSFTDATPDSPDLSQVSPGPFHSASLPRFPVVTFPTVLLAGDFQGRGMLLGSPLQQTFVHYQPDMVISAPPMHVDYIAPSGQTTPEVLNLSAVPSAFYSFFRDSNLGSEQTAMKNSISTTLGANVSASGTISMNVPLEFGVTAQGAASAALQLKNNIGNSFSTFDEVTFKASDQTGWGDQVLFHRRAITVWAYPVIGLTACTDPSATSFSDCDPDAVGPLYMIFSGPENLTTVSAAANTLEWYQPLHHVGNILTYTTSLAQLSLGLGKLSQQDSMLNLGLLTEDNTTFFTDSSIETESVSWMGTAGAQTSVGSAANLTASLSGSATVRLGTQKNGVSTTFGAGLNAGAVQSTLQMSKQSFSGTSGVEIKKPGSFQSPDDYKYAFQPLVFSTPFPSGTIDQGTVEGLSIPADVQGTGPIQLAYTANPSDAEAGFWWSVSGYHDAPDVALQLPLQWSINNSATETGSNCLRNAPTSSVSSCASIAQKHDFSTCNTCMWTSQFYRMKGFTVTTSGMGNEVQATHAQYAAVGEQVTLNLRVYNLSFRDMTDQTVHVRFYRQPWTPTQPGSGGNVPNGASVLVGEVTLGDDGIHYFSSNPNQLNWTEASITFEAAQGMEGSYIFWAVVWAEDVSGNLVSEVPGHGLQGLPPDNPFYVSDIPVEQYSNNVGFYPVAFEIVDPSNIASLEGATPLTLAMDSPMLSLSNMPLGESMDVSALVASEEADTAGVMVVMSEKQSDEAEFRIFDVENLGFMHAGEPYQVRVAYRPSTCGIHEVKFEAYGLGGELQTTSTFVQADIDPIDATGDFARFVYKSDLPGKTRRSLGAKLRIAKWLFSKGRTRAALAMLQAFSHEVEARREPEQDDGERRHGRHGKKRGKTIPSDFADGLIAESTRISECVALL